MQTQALQTQATVLIVPGLREHVADHWQTLLQARLDKARSVPPLTHNQLDCQARIDNLQQAIAEIEGDIILVAHSAGCLMVAHWAARLDLQRDWRRIKGALLATPPDMDTRWPDNYPSPHTLRACGWAPLPPGPLPFPSILVCSSNDHLASPQAAARLARRWGSRLLHLGAIGHLNPASGFGPWPQAEALITELDRVPTEGRKQTEEDSTCLAR